MKMLVERSKTAQVSRILRIAPPVPRRGVVKLRDGEFIGGRKRETTSTQEKTPNENKILKLSRSPSPRRLTRPTSGRSPDSRFNGLAAFPIVYAFALFCGDVHAISGILASPPRSQWRGRAGLSPAFLLSLQRTRSDAPLGYASWR